MSLQRPAFHRSATLKLLGVGFLALLMAIPLSMLDDLRREREGRRGEAEQALAASYGDAQRVGAPLLRVPVEVRETRSNGVAVHAALEQFQRHLLPVGAAPQRMQRLTGAAPLLYLI